jgi:tungstate transport system substrate-binding protein
MLNGSLPFRGEVDNEQYSGTAYIFNPQCGRIPFEVTGSVVGNGERLRTNGSYLFTLRRTALALITTLGVAVFLAQPAAAQEKSIIVASTTSTKGSGLFHHLLPIFKQKTGIAVNVVAVGTGQALDVARQGQADVVFVHAKLQELRFIAEGEGVKRYPVMYNDFVLMGPKSDPAHIVGMDDVAEALRKIKTEQAPFVSRGDRSGTHFAELALWHKDAGINIEKERGPWYTSIGQGMIATLQAAAASGAYTLSDRSTWISLKDNGDLQIVLEGDRRLFNQYSVILVNPAKHPNVKKDFGQQFIDWLVSPEGQKAIAGYEIHGEQLFFPNAGDPDS